MVHRDNGFGPSASTVPRTSSVYSFRVKGGASAIRSTVSPGRNDVSRTTCPAASIFIRAGNAGAVSKSTVKLPAPSLITIFPSIVTVAPLIGEPLPVAITLPW